MTPPFQCFYITVHSATKQCLHLASSFQSLYGPLLFYFSPCLCYMQLFASYFIKCYLFPGRKGGKTYTFVSINIDFSDVAQWLAVLTGGQKCESWAATCEDFVMHGILIRRLGWKVYLYGVPFFNVYIMKIIETKIKLETGVSNFKAAPRIRTGWNSYVILLYRTFKLWAAPFCINFVMYWPPANRFYSDPKFNSLVTTARG
jgi:hypothetical protein